jgi:hypothetical protein
MTTSSRGSAGEIFRVAVAIDALLTTGCTDSGSDGVGPSAVATGGESGRIKLEATFSERSGACPAIRFRLGSIVVETTAETDFEIPCAQIVNGAAIEAQAPLVTGNVLTAREVEADASAAGDSNFEAEGPIAMLSGSDGCAGAGRTVTIQGLSFRVQESADFREISGCSALAAGIVVRARGPLATPSGAPNYPAARHANGTASAPASSRTPAESNFRKSSGAAHRQRR